MSSNYYPELIKAMDRLNLYRALNLGQLQSPQAIQQAQQMFGRQASTLGQRAGDIMRGGSNRLLGVSGFIPDMLRIQMGGLTDSEIINNANRYYQQQGLPYRFNTDGSIEL